MIGVLNTFSEEKVMVEKERQSNAYRLSAYYFAKLISEVPFNLMGTVFFGTIIYWIV